VRYTPAELGAVGPPPEDAADHGLLGKSLLERAGLKKEEPPETRDEPLSG